METANVTGRVSRGRPRRRLETEVESEQVADRRAADQQYRRHRHSDAAVRSAENANMKRCRQESRQRSAAEYYEAALHDRSL